VNCNNLICPELFSYRCQFLRQEEFHELRGVSPENLMYIKEDVIIPHTYTFYDLIVSKARGSATTSGRDDFDFRSCRKEWAAVPLRCT